MNTTAFHKFTAEHELNPAPLREINGLPALALPGDGHLISDFAEELGGLLAGHGLFARKGAAFTLNHEGEKLELATAAWLRTWVEKHAVPFKTRTSRDGEITLKRTMPDDTARAVLASPQFLEALPSIERFHPCPMPWLREGGQIQLLPVGIDAESATFTADPGFPIKRLPMAEATATLDTLLEEFAWPQDGGRSKAVHVAAMLTVFAGGIMPPGSTRPVFLYLANAEGSGKTTLAQLTGMPYAETAAEAAPKDETEWQKKLLSVVISGRRFVLLDNLKGHLNSPALEAYATATHYTGRILGVSKEFTGEAGATVIITGNSLTISADMRRRALCVELFMPELRPEDRQFRRTLDPVAIRGWRPDILSALWSVVAEWNQAGRPGASRGNSSFPRWTETIGGMVELAGYTCPTTPAAIEGMGDTDTADMAALGEGMESRKRYSFADLAGLADEAGLFERLLSDREAGELSRRAKRAFSALLARFDRRHVIANGIFRVEGKGHTRRYCVTASE